MRVDQHYDRLVEIAGGWIPTSERLPPEGDHVLVWWPNALCSNTSYHIMVRGPHDLAAGGITHWMPLPEPPK